MDEELRERLREAVTEASGGSADDFGRQIGYTNGGYIREILNGKKPVREAIISRVHALPGFGEWFSDLVPLQRRTTSASVTTQVGGICAPQVGATTARGRPVGQIVVGAVGIRASMGAGADRSMPEEIVSQMTIDEAWLRRNCTFTSIENLSLISGHGDSMRPTFEDGDALLVDRGIRECRVDSVYCFALNDELYVKRLQRRPDGTVMMISDNRAYEPYQITQGKDRVEVLGRVVMAWNARRM